MRVLLTVDKLCKTYKNGSDVVCALRDVSFEIGAGECLGLVGESGSGKSTVAKLLLALERPDSGDVRFENKSLVHIDSRKLRTLRRFVQVVFQDPTASLNNRLPIWRSVIEPLDNFPQAQLPFFNRTNRSRRETALHLLQMVGLEPEHLDRYPHELSGGQKQRVAIARGISLSPKLLICDEPTSSLDVTVQAQILMLLKQLQKKLNMSYLFVSHDIATVQQMSDRIVIMKEGRIVDLFSTKDLWSEKRHAYTRLLVAAAEEMEL
ncbi:ABC transporter ATP-binding protein [Paenibacillus sp. GSMTC-2017]|uniref:ABC transporter ATP-binding protein n=1 Tax=Paenibacillus sp. GSMTC-2017 TaxID=2794350 RepID=UPI0018DA1B59|nr:dipeptide/oligopeptide/nickel ABC transporter ATP-binding protein [Paenibacillus sp. GSMTC-2017]MBH5316428.1 ABC transporter ATP-binding protein [Paenibacillus sp. GSMTC-2017]